MLKNRKDSLEKMEQIRVKDYGYDRYPIKLKLYRELRSDPRLSQWEWDELVRFINSGKRGEFSMMNEYHQECYFKVKTTYEVDLSRYSHSDGWVEGASFEFTSEELDQLLRSPKEEL